MKFLSAAFERSQTAFVGRRKTAALLLNDIAKTAEEYWWSQPQNVPALAEVCDIVAKEHGTSPLEVRQRMFWPLRARRLALRPLLTRGSKGIIGFGIGHEFGTALKNSTRDIELFCMMLSERIHVAHALNATTFLSRNEPSAFSTLANSMGSCLNTFRSFNTRLAKNWLKNEHRKDNPARLLPPIPLLEFERSLPLKELLTACDDVMLRNYGRSLLSRIAELPESDRAAEITRLSGELRRLGKPKGFMTLDNADTIIAAASILFGFVYPPLAGIRVIGGQILDRLRHNPMVAKALDRLTSDLFGDHSERDELDFLSQVSRVAVLKTDRVS